MTMRLTTETTAGKVSLDPMGALKQAWMWYLGFLVAPMLLIVLSSWSSLVGWHVTISAHESRMAFIATLMWVGVTGPLGFLGQEYFFRRYFKGEGVSAKDYIHGKVFVWSLLASGAMLAAVFIWLSESLFPHLFSIAVVYPFLLTQYPDGRAMTYHHGNSERAQLYAEPK